MTLQVRGVRVRVRMGLCSDVFSRPVVMNVSSACSRGGGSKVTFVLKRSNTGEKGRFHPPFNCSCRYPKRRLV